MGNYLIALSVGIFLISTLAHDRWLTPYVFYDDDMHWGWFTVAHILTISSAVIFDIGRSIRSNVR